MGTNTKQIFSLLVLCFTAIVFLPSLSNQFTNWDDDKFIIENPDIRNLDVASITKTFRSFYEGGYQPLTQLSFSLDYKIWGLNPFGYHLTAVLLHVLNAGLVFLVFQAFGLSVGLAALATIFWSTHPMRVESVVWVAERKDVVFAFFSLLAWLWYVHGRIRLAWFAFVLACLAKHQAALLGFTLPFIDFFKQAKTGTGPMAGRSVSGLGFALREIWIKQRQGVYAGFIVTGLAILMVTSVYSHRFWSNQGMFPWLDKMILMSWSLLVYAVKSFVPYQLAVLYPYPAKVNQAFPWFIYAAPILVIAWGAFVWAHRRQYPLVFFGSVFFVVNMILPLANIIAGGYMMNDRYTYIPSLGLWLIAAGLLRDGWRMNLSRAIRWGIVVVIISLLSLSVGTTLRYTKVWYDGVTLWSHMISQYPFFAPIYENRATAYAKRGKDDKALADLSSAIRLNPTYASAYNNRAVVYDKKGRLDLAMDDWNRAVALDAHYGSARFNRGISYFHQGRMQEAWNDLQEARRLGILVPDDFLGYIHHRLTTDPVKGQ